MKKIIFIFVLFTGVSLVLNSCVKDLDTKPIDPDEVTSATVFDNPESYTQFLAKCYAGLAIGGQQGGDGMADISGIDGGFSQYLRQYWYHQELTTDEAVIGWDDATIKDFHFQQWGDGDTFIAAMYYRIYYQISLCNEFLRQTTDDLLDERGVSDEWRNKIAFYRVESRWLRALSYWHVLDLFGNGVPFVIESDPIGDFFPPAIAKAELFNFIESELTAIEGSMIEPPHFEYGRADKGAAWMLLAKLYFNAEVYLGVNKYAECITYCEKIINGPYALSPTFQQLFWANNDQDATTIREIIFPIRYNGQKTQTWGGTTFIIAASIGGEMEAQNYGTAERWGGTRTTKEFVALFSDDDSREMFFTEGQNLEIENISTFEEGYAVTKFRNVWYNENGDTISGSSETFMDTDFPMFRLADVYLMYAEAVKRGGGGNEGQAVEYVNDLRQRVGASAITAGDMDLDFILDERGRELYWECHRRTDLIRHNKFTGDNYIWAWKGNIKDGRSTDAKYNLFPLPAADVNGNPNLNQNPNY
ncbi:MAG: RagB/SusD family nutrient uptake outer membrane protein [Bacteroidetes bacterium]|nr:RagB/SusD family nutrient uptake outer membrane protein [Bacteroidota bacterium]MBL7103963.1 RagB/SusD family nutrient uptake outer membrane protein [Bacteroidales bacterium]